MYTWNQPIKKSKSLVLQIKSAKQKFKIFEQVFREWIRSGRSAIVGLADDAYQMHLKKNIFKMR